MQLGNGIIFINRQEDRYNTEEFAREIMEYAEPHIQPDGIILENDTLKGILRSTMWYGFGGVNVKLFFEEWRKIQADLERNRPKESITKTYEPTGQMITMSKSYGGYHFTDKELDDLYAGKSIVITFTTQYGNERTVEGRLQKKDWPEKEIQFWAFVTKDLDNQEDNMVTGIYQGEKIKFKNQFADHKLTEEEINKLLSGKAIYLVITNKNGKRTSVRVKLTKVDNDFYKLQGQFDDIPYCMFSGRELTPNEIEQLHLGRVVLLQNLLTRDGKLYSTEVRWKDGKYQVKKKSQFEQQGFDFDYQGYGNGDIDSN